MDIEQIKQLIELMVEHDLSRLEIQEGETHILLKRGGTPIVQAVGAAMPPAQAPQPAAAPQPTAPATSPGAPGEAEGGEPQPESHEVFIRSPMVGTFYAAPDPESPPFVKVGDVVTPETVVCLIEAMKVFNEIKAEVSGRITRVLVNNAEAVEYDQPLFAVAPA